MNHLSNGCVQRFRDIQKQPRRYAIIDLRELSLYGFARFAAFQTAHREWINQALEVRACIAHDRRSKAIAVGILASVENIKTGLNSGAKGCIVELNRYALREPDEAYAHDFGGDGEPLMLENTSRAMRMLKP